MLLENLFYWNLIKAINDVAKCIIIKPIALNTSEHNIREFLWGALVVVFGAKSDSSLLAPNFIGNQEIVVNGSCHIDRDYRMSH
jgi:hypothetical protein